ncbi:MAG TPA: tetratricopeptide repeat protein, partial [bacterium]|nr:tetratricopeptide repeat protein [bacterium]
MKNVTLGVLFSLFSLVPAFVRADATDYRDMGQALYQKGLYAKAVDYFRQAVAADPNDWQSYQSMGDCYMKMDSKPEALEAYQKSLDINPDNSAVQTQVNNLTAAGVQPPSNSASNPSTGQFDDSQPVTETQTVIIKRRRFEPRPRPTPVVYNDSLAAMDHAKVWTQFSIGYSNSRNNELITSANSWNNDMTNNGWTGSASASSDGLNLGFELGFLINPNSGLALGVKYINTADYTL